MWRLRVAETVQYAGRLLPQNKLSGKNDRNVQAPMIYMNKAHRNGAGGGFLCSDPVELFVELI